jgi:hypothetical protein
MFARVITAQADTEGVDDAVELARRQLPAARQRPGFQGYQLLSNAESHSRAGTRLSRTIATAGARSTGTTITASTASSQLSRPENSRKPAPQAISRLSESAITNAADG